MRILFKPIGIIHTPFLELSGMPIQPSGAKNVKGTVEINPKFSDALADLDGFSHIYLIYYFHKSKKFKLQVKPFLDDTKRGLFATRAPCRPNAIGLSLVRLLSVDKNELHIDGIDVINETPLLDIKPYIGQIEPIENLRIGWLASKASNFVTQKADERFKKMQ